MYSKTHSPKHCGCLASKLTVDDRLQHTQTCKLFVRLMDCQVWWVKINLGTIRRVNGLRDQTLLSSGIAKAEVQMWPLDATTSTCSKTLLFHRYFCLLKMCKITWGLWFRLPLWHVYVMKQIYHTYFALWIQRDFFRAEWSVILDDVSVALGFCWGNYSRWMTGLFFFSWTYVVLTWRKLDLVPWNFIGKWYRQRSRPLFI